MISVLRALIHCSADRTQLELQRELVVKPLRADLFVVFQQSKGGRPNPSKRPRLRGGGEPLFDPPFDPRRRLSRGGGVPL